MKLTSRYLSDELSLFLNMKKSRVSSPMELKYLGFGYCYDEDIKKWRLTAHPESVEKFLVKLEKLTQENLHLSLDVLNEKLKQSIEGWVVYFRIAELEDVAVLLDDELRTWMRVAIWKRWVAQNKQIISLVKLGISVKGAKELAWSFKGEYFIAKSRVLQRALSAEKLKQMGVLSVLDYYLRHKV